MNLSFKRGGIYTRKSIGEICFPGVGRPKGGNWDTGYVRVENNVIIFMNIGVAGRTGHNFDNFFERLFSKSEDNAVSVRLATIKTGFANCRTD